MATAAYTTVVDRAIGDPLTEAIWDDQLKDNVNMLLGKASGNLLTNGGFEVWQRGVGPFTADTVRTADSWQQNNGTAASVTTTQETTTIAPDSAYSLKCVTTALAGFSSSVYFEQKVEADFVKQLRGKSISLTVKAQQSVASKFTASITGSIAGTVTSASSATTGSYVTYTVTLAVPATETSLAIRLIIAGSGTYYLDNAMLVVGPNAAPYEPLHPQEELARCQRYYEIVAGFNFLGSANGAHNMGQWVPWAVTKFGAPTITKNGTWAVTNCGQPTVASGSVSGCIIYAAATGAGQVQFTTNSADDTISAESNP